MYRLKLRSVVLLAVALCAFSSREVLAQDDGVSGAVTFGANNAFVDGTGSTLYPEPIFSWSFLVNLPSDTSLGVWNSIGLADSRLKKQPDYGDEFDIFVEQRFGLGFWGLRGKVYWANLQIEPLNSLSGGSISRLVFGLSRDLVLPHGGVITFHGTREEFGVIGGPDDFKGGSLWSFGLSTADTEFDNRMKADLGMGAFRNNGAFGMKPGWLGEIQFQINFLLLPKSQVTMGSDVRVLVPLSDGFSDGRENVRFIVGLGVTIPF